MSTDAVDIDAGDTRDAGDAAMPPTVAQAAAMSDSCLPKLCTW
jgi:hypothetical protein